MSTSVVGLDVGTHAVRAVELSIGRGKPGLRRLAQVTLPPGAVVAGEVIDATAVSAALRRLWREGGFKSRSVVVGVANPRVVARITELPAMPDEELRTSLRFQVQDLVPMPLEDAELDFEVVERDVEVDGEQRVRILLVAAHRDMLRSLLAALDGAGLEAARVDLIPLALIRAARQDPSAAAEGGDDVIIGSGAGVTNVVIHRGGTPSFVRSLPAGGAAVTDAIATDFDIDPTVAEAVKRHLGEPVAEEEYAGAAQLVAASLLPLANDVVGSLEFHSGQTESVVPRRVVVSGGAARLDALRDLLEEQLGSQLGAVEPFHGLDVSHSPIDLFTLREVADNFTVAVGLALPNESGSTSARINLVPKGRSAAREQRRQLVMAGGAVAVVALALAGASVARSGQVDDAHAQEAAATADVATLTTQVAGLSDVAKVQAQVATGSQAVTAVLAGDVAWPTLLQDISASLPGDVWLTSLNATRGANGILGSIQATGVGSDQTAGARWLEQTAKIDSLTNPWVGGSIQADAPSGAKVVNLSVTADLAPGALSDRAAQLTEVRP